MGFFDGFGSSAAALGRKLGQVGDFALDLAPKVSGIYQSVQQIKLLANGKPPRSDQGSIPVPGQLPPAAVVEPMPEPKSGMQAALPLLLIGGLVVAAVAVRK